jgi:hypothetical protein
VSEHKYNKETHKSTSKLLGSKPTLREAVEASDKYIYKDYSDRIKLISTNSGWRKKEPSEAQINLLKKFKVNNNVLETIDKGQASRLITKLINKERQERKIIRKYNPFTGSWYTKKIGGKSTNVKQTP